ALATALIAHGEVGLVQRDRTAERKAVLLEAERRLPGRERRDGVEAVILEEQQRAAAVLVRARLRDGARHGRHRLAELRREAVGQHLHLLDRLEAVARVDGVGGAAPLREVAR